jgi:hypothetical protein
VRLSNCGTRFRLLVQAEQLGTELTHALFDFADVGALADYLQIFDQSCQRHFRNMFDKEAGDGPHGGLDLFLPAILKWLIRDDRDGEAYLVDGRSYVAQTVHGVLCK